MITAGCFSCSKPVDPNEVFNQKYGAEIRANSTPKTVTKEIDIKNLPRAPFSPVTPQEVFLENIKRQVQYYPYYDVNKFGQKFEGGYYSGNEAIQQSNINGQNQAIPPDIFDIIYTPRYYKTFSYQGARFDNIRIPNRDKYGVDTSLARKEYLMSGNNALQNSIDLIRDTRTKEDVENSKIIIKEQKELRQKQDMINIFGYDVFMIREKIDNAQKQQNADIAKELEELNKEEEKEIIEESQDQNSVNDIEKENTNEEKTIIEEVKTLEKAN